MDGFVFAGMVPSCRSSKRRDTVSKVENNDEFAKLSLRHKTLKEQVANEIEMYAELVSTLLPNIKAEYMMRVGQLECQVLRLGLAAKRWKRRFELRQMYVNRGEKPDMVAIESTLDEEFAAWSRQVDEMYDDIKNSKLLCDMEKMSSTDTNNIRCEYLKAVKKLHPDINGELSPAAASLWNQIQAAYAKENWPQLKFLVSLVDEVVGADTMYENTPEQIEKLRADCAALEVKLREVAARIAELKSKPPYTLKVLLDDPSLLNRKQEQLKNKVAELSASVKKFEEEWNNG